MLTEARNVTIFVSSFLNFVQLGVLHFLCRQYRALNERSYWLIEMNIRKTLQASTFSFIVLNLAEKAVLHFFLIILNYIMSALRKKQLQLPRQSTLKKNRWNPKNISFQFHYDKKLVSKSNLQDLIAAGGDFPCPSFFEKVPRLRPSIS